MKSRGHQLKIVRGLEFEKLNIEKFAKYTEWPQTNLNQYVIDRKGTGRMQNVHRTMHDWRR